MKVSDAMTRKVNTIQTDASVLDALHLMLSAKFSGLPVVDSTGTLVGMITEGDFLRRSELDTERKHARWLTFLLSPGRLAREYALSHARKVGEVMTSGVVTIDENAPLADAVALMEERHIKRLPVVANGVLTGILSRSDLLKAYLGAAPIDAAAETSDAQLLQRIQTELDRQSWVPHALITLKVSNGVVDIEGIVTDERTREALNVLVENQAGVARVRDHLTTIEPNSGIVVREAAE